MATPRLFTEDEEIYLEYYIFSQDEPDYAAAAEELGVTTEQIANWRWNTVKQRGKKLEPLVSRYTEREVDLIKRYYRTRSVGEIAEMLGRSHAGVADKICRLGLSKTTYPSKKDAEIRELCKTHTLKEVAELLGFPLPAIRSYVYHQKFEYVREVNKGHYWRQQDKLLFKAK